LSTNRRNLKLLASKKLLGLLHTLLEA
jgi:hypothetical protein